MKNGISEFVRGTTWLFLVAVSVALLAGTASAAPLHFNYANGMSVTVYPAADLAARLTPYQGSSAIELPDGRMLPVITSVDDASIYNKGDGSFHPFTPELVDAALSAIQHPDMHLAVRVYLLPYPRQGVLVSSTSGNEMFLSPLVLDIEPDVAAYIIAHELGHVFHNHFMPADSPRWGEYRQLRGITDENTFNENAQHAYRPREIFAEDFRVLFGGPAAYFGGHVENSAIAEPEAVAGLRDFYLRAAQEPARGARIAASSSPNPFNPETEIRVTVPSDATVSGARVSVRVYAVTGALVRDLYDGVTSGDLAVRWDGTDNRGNRVASSTYYAQIRMGNERETLKLVLLK
ncbi:MAG TPA: hypothetical protein VFH88_12850 [Candidatus Krumholzibacteria bacterium]|nr:hypothetical protein [Candidatus Krumholzibacteria bacterium]